ncbi:MAG: FecR family protein [Candidatus Azobacteroides sp.]|nr:FecR family protein [Candidatus Azobacteroides sp.]
MKNEFITLLEKFLQKQAGTEETERLIELFNQPGILRIFSELYREKWDNAEFHTDSEVEKRIWSRLNNEIQAKPIPVVKPWWKKYSRIAAAILIPALMAGLTYYYMGSRLQDDSKAMRVHVEMGQKANMTLPDGTQVWLNSAGSLSYDNSYNKKDRTVHLQGEAFFEVSKDKKRPFKVIVNEITVEALGTSFDVKGYPEDNRISTTLIEGKIKVSNDKESYALYPNEKIVFNKQLHSFTKTTLMDAEKSGSWRNNELAFDQENLEEIAKVLERMYNTKIIFASEDLKKIHFSGKVKNSNLESVLQLVSFVSPIQYSFKDSVIVIRENLKEKHLYKKYN